MEISTNTLFFRMSKLYGTLKNYLILISVSDDVLKVILVINWDDD